jgi:hypothetical protein
MPKVLNIKDMQNIATHYHGKCLSGEYVENRPLMWMCKKGHTWDSLFSIVKQGGWCPTCMKEEARREEYMNRLKDFVEKKGGKCLTDNYENINTKILFECKNKHTWWSTSPSIIRQNSWCMICRRESEDVKRLEELQKIAAINKGKCLSEKYKNPDSKLKWQCQKDHIFLMTPHIAKAGHWCLECYREEIREKEFKRLQTIAEKKGGKCLSNNYKTEHSRLKWQCKEGHIWYKLACVVKSGSWCKECNRINVCENELKKIQIFAKKKGGVCLSEMYKNSYSKIKWKCDKGHLWAAQPSNVVRVNGTWCPVCSKELADQKQRLNKEEPSVEKYQLIAKKLGGELLSKKYIDSETPLRWKCGKGHIWSKAPQSIRSGVWCPVCSEENRKLKIEDLQDLAAKLEGELLTKEYAFSHIKMEWLCKRGHTWMASANNIKRGGWCPTCNNDKKKSSIEEYQKIAKSHGGLLISKEYINNVTPLEWQCKNNHKWSTTPFIIKQGSWCPFCPK